MIPNRCRIPWLLTALAVATVIDPSLWGQNLPAKSQPQVSRQAQKQVGRSYHVGPRARSGRLSSSVSGGVEFYVATNGRDDEEWTGRYPSPNAEGTDGPFATLEGARDKIRELRVGGEISPPIIVNIRAGTYILNQPFDLESQDSGEEGAPVVYRAYPVDKMIGGVVVSGGRRITSEWRSVRGRLGEPIDIDYGSRPIYMTDVPPLEDGAVWRFNSLFVDGDRATRARSPNLDAPFPYFMMVEGEAQYALEPHLWCNIERRNCLRRGICPSPSREEACAGSPVIPDDDFRSFTFSGSDIDGGWGNLGEVEVVALKAWEQTRQRLSSVDGDRATLHSDIDKPYWYTGFSGRYYVDNLRSALDSPGEWYLDPRNSRLYYWPLPGQDMNRVEVIAPAPGLTQLVKLLPGTHDITFQGLTFAHTDWVLSDQGHIGCQAGVCMATPPTIEFQASGPSAMNGIGTEGIQFLDNAVAHTGGYALGGPTRLSVIRGNTIYDTGGGGIRIGAIDDTCPDSVGWPLGHWEEQFLSEQNEIMDNTIHDIGKVYLESVGIQDLLSRNTTIAYNHIYNTPYSGISFGWRWQSSRSRATECAEGLPSCGNKIENNHIHHVGQILTDLGGIYTLGRQPPGSLIRRNLVHDVLFTPDHFHHTSLAGIYLDQGSYGWTVSENIVHRIASAAFTIHQGSFNIIENNIFVDASVAEELMENHDYGQIGFASPFCAVDDGLSDDVRAVYRHPESGRINWRNPQGADCPEDLRGRRPPQGNTFQHNIVYGSPPQSDRKLIHYDLWSFPFVSSNHNLFFRPRTPRSPGNLWQWQREMRQDLNSINVDPLFQDVARGNFGLRPGSPASRVGFSPFILTVN